MWNYEKRLQFPINIKEPNAKLAQVIISQYGGPDGAAAEWYKPPASDINVVLALALFVFVCYHAAGIWRRGIIGHPVKVL